MTSNEPTPPFPPAEARGNPEATLSWGEYRWSCLTLAGMYDDLGLSGESQYLESLVAGVVPNDPTPVPFAEAAAMETDGYWRRVLGLLIVQQAEDQGELLKIQKRMAVRAKQIRVAGSYHSGCDDGAAPFGRDW